MDKRLFLGGASVALLTAAMATTAFAQSPAAPLASLAPDGAPEASLAVEGADLPHPAHIHDGLCPDPGDVVQPLSDLVVGTDKPVGVSSAVPVEISASTVPMSLNDILGAERSINVHESADAMDTYIACGDIGGQMLGDNALAIGLEELNGSGHRGVAWLQDNGDGSTNVQVFLIASNLGLSGDNGSNAGASMAPGSSMAPVGSAAPMASGAPTETTVPVTTTVPEETILPQPTTVASEVPVMTVVPSVVPDMTTVPVASASPAS